MIRFALAISFTVASLGAVPISVLYYDIPNGSGLNYLDETYVCQNIVACSPDANKTVGGVPLTGGLGQLTDGVIASLNWDLQTVPYVGWADFNPLLQFYFAAGHTISTVTISFDDSNGGGGVSLPSAILFETFSASMTIPVVDPPDSAPLSVTFDVSSLGATDYLSIRPTQKQSWIFISEVSFDGEPDPVPEPDSGKLFASAFLATLAAGAWRRSAAVRRLRRPSA